MLTFEFAQVPSVMNNMAGGALKRLSAAVGYNMACHSQEEVEKQLPEYRATWQKLPGSQPLQERIVSDTQSIALKSPKAETTASVDVLKSTIEQKENLRSVKVIALKSATSNEKPLKPKGKVKPRDKFRAETQSRQKQHRREISKKIREGRARRNSWRPDQILKNRWAKMSPEERKELIQKFDHMVTTGAIKTYDWLTWNIPKYSIKMMYLVMSGEVPEYATDAIKMCDLMRDLDRL